MAKSVVLSESETLNMPVKEEILSQIRPFVFGDVCARVSGILDMHQSEISRFDTEISQQGPAHWLMQDRIAYLTKALAMIAKVPATTDGAIAAKGIAEEAISTIDG